MDVRILTFLKKKSINGYKIPRSARIDLAERKKIVLDPNQLDAKGTTAIPGLIVGGRQRR